MTVVIAAYRLRTPTGKWQWMDGAPCAGTLRLAEDHGWEIEYAYTAPGGVGDAVTDTQRLDWLTEQDAIDRTLAQTIGGEWCAQDDVVGAWYGGTPREAIDAALAARTGKGEANGR